MPEASTPQAAFQLLQGLTRHERHVFWPDTFDLSSAQFPLNPLRGHQQITDAYLFSLAIEKAGRLVTLDSGLAALARDQSQRDAIVLLGTP